MTGTSRRLPLVSCNLNHQRLRMVKVVSHEYSSAVATPRITDRANHRAEKLQQWHQHEIDDLDHPQ
jgi:hypothetical protein